MTARFRDRRDAGRRLGAAVAERLAHADAVLGLPRGGVPVAFEVAEQLHAPLDVLVVRKLGVPSQPELAMGAVGEGGVVVRNDDVLAAAHISPEELARVTEREQALVIERVTRWRPTRPAVSLEGATVVVVDDGLATGATARAGVAVARARGAARVVLAVPVAPADAVEELAGVADDVVAVLTPRHFGAVGSWYERFDQTTDEEVVELLRRAAPPQD